MNYDLMIKNVHDKIMSGNNSFTTEDYIIIENNDDLKNDLIEAISNKVLPIKFELSLFIVERIGLENIDHSYVNVFYDILKNYIDNGYASSYIVADYVKMFNLDSEFVEKANNYLEEKYKDINYKFTNSDIDNEIINKLLDYKRYDIISLFDITRPSVYNYAVYGIDDKTYNRIVNEWPDEKIPDIIAAYQKSKDIYNYENDSLDDLINECYRCVGNKKIELFNLIVEKLNDYSSLDFLADNTIFGDLLYDIKTTYGIKFDIDSLFKTFFDKNYLTVSDYLVKKNVISKQNVNDKLNYCIENHLNFTPHILDFLGIGTNFGDKCIKLLLDYGHLDYLIKYEKTFLNDDSRILENYIDYINMQIDNDNPYYEKYLTTLNLDLSKYKELFSKIVNKGKLKAVNLMHFDKIDDLYDDILKLGDTNNGLTVQLSIQSKDKDNLAKYLIDRKKYKLLLLNNLLTVNFIKNNEDLILECLDDIYFANEFILVYNFFDSKKILAKLLSNKILVGKLLDRIIHNDAFDSIYNHDNYLILRDYFVKKYNLNIDHFDEIERRLGSKIIRYIENENLHKIINLDDETFQKIINLFPTVEYTIRDSEASYESLIQYAYSKNKINDMTIFPKFIHALDDNDNKIVNNLREKLIIHTKKDFLDNIVSKYNLENINYTYELIDLIIKNYNTKDRETYINILHDLTNEYIANSRKEYHNNHFFEEKYIEFSNYFDNFLNAIDALDEDKILLNIGYIILHLDNNFYQIFSKKYNITEELKSPYNLMNYLVEKVRNKETRDEYLPIIKEVVDYYYDKERNKHLKEIDIKEELSLPYDLEEKSKNNEIIRYLAENCDKYCNKDGEIILNVVIDNLEKKGLSTLLIIDCFKYFRGDKNKVIDINGAKENLKVVVEEINNYIRNNIIYNKYGRVINKEEIVRTLDKEHKIKRIYKNPNKIDQYQILINLNIELLKNNLFNNTQRYNELLDLITKKKIHLIPENLKQMIEKTGLSSDYSNIACFINYYIPIIESEKRRLESLGKNTSSVFNGISSILINAETYSSVSSVYSLVLTDKDAKLIKSNPGPNSAVKKLNKNERLDEAISITLQNYQRKSVTVPPINTNVYVNSEKTKKINVTVGNFTDPSLLTLGERTGACMRIGGVGESLFNFCLQNQNGFHILFTDSDTNEFISRVSGFRNGNTVFLNELRYSCNKEKYSNEEVYEACVEISKILIEKSKESNYPIDNVVIANEYAVSKPVSDVVYLNISDNKKGLPKFYSDVANSVIVLATTSKDSKFVPVDFNKKNIPVYDTCRVKPQVIVDSAQLIPKINRVSAIKNLLNGVDIEDLESIKLDSGIICGIVSDDWYVYIDNNRVIHYDLIECDERAMNELNTGLSLIESIADSIIEDNKYGDEISYGFRN